MADKTGAGRIGPERFAEREDGSPERPDIPEGSGIIKRLAYNKRGKPVLHVAFPNGGPNLKLDVILHYIPVRIVVTEQIDDLLAVVRDLFSRAKDAPPEMLMRAAAVLAAVEAGQ